VATNASMSRRLKASIACRMISTFSSDIARYRWITASGGLGPVAGSACR
jgi:hypothetical protein